MTLRAPTASLVLLAGAFVVAVGCEARLFHTFGAFPYNVAQGCLEGAVAVDIVDGPDPGACAEVHCWVNPGGEIFVSDQACDAPLDFTESAAGPCKLALEALKKRTMCSNAAVDAGGAGGS